MIAPCKGTTVHTDCYGVRFGGARGRPHSPFRASARRGPPTGDQALPVGRPRPRRHVFGCARDFRDSKCRRLASGPGGSYSIGSSSCSSTGQSIAIAIGPNASATASGAGTVSIAVGESTRATATGTGNLASASGRAARPRPPTARSSGVRAGAIAQNGNRHHASSFGTDVGSVAEGSDAQGVGTGNNNRGFAIGRQSGAIAQNGNSNRSFTLGTGSGSLAKNGNRKSAKTIGNNSSATATGNGARHHGWRQQEQFLGRFPQRQPASVVVGLQRRDVGARMGSPVLPEDSDTARDPRNLKLCRGIRRRHHDRVRHPAAALFGQKPHKAARGRPGCECDGLRITVLPRQAEGRPPGRIVGPDEIHTRVALQRARLRGGVRQDHLETDLRFFSPRYRPDGIQGQ